MTAKKVWFVPGTSKGWRLKLVRQLLEEGYCVAVTLTLQGNAEDWLNDYPSEQLLQILIRNKAVNKGDALARAISHFGKIDEIVNNPRLWLQWR
ncbi:hypothetical protein [Mucilaginibacter sp.]|uniref:hypothetical protein n=1 Tax=Mucilaginibacter sp. TaxID=1882438 RepID=UPI0025DFD80E|nr:hypothetical protein [Mucilaginibacter sp.]